MKYKTLKTKSGRNFHFFTIIRIIAGSGLGVFCLAYLAFFFVCALVIFLGNPAVGNYFDCVWLCFQSITTIGFGDMNTTQALTRVVIICLAFVSLFFLAIITGVVVAYINQLIKKRLDDVESVVLDDLERLPELSKDELKNLAEKIKKRRNR